jgi:hypothetical protein
MREKRGPKATLIPSKISSIDKPKNSTPSETYFFRSLLTLAGYLADVRLDGSVLVAWHTLAGSPDFVLPSLWAALRCAADRPGGALNTILPAIFTVSGEKTAGGWSKRNTLFQELAFSTNHGFSPAVLSLLSELANRDDR